MRMTIYTVATTKISSVIVLLKNKAGTEMGVLEMENHKLWQKNEVTRD
jgi:hypothetical protein